MIISFSAVAVGEGGPHYVLQRIAGARVAILPKNWDGNSKLIEGEILRDPRNETGVLLLFDFDHNEKRVLSIEDIEEVRYL